MLAVIAFVPPDDESHPCPKVAAPVPPFPTPSVPVMSVARSTSAVATAPAVALRKPVTDLKVKLFEAMRFEVDAVPETVSAVEEAYGN